jgi:hypothetical protein
MANAGTVRLMPGEQGLWADTATAMSSMFGRQMALEVLGEGAEMPITEQYCTPFHAFRNIGVWGHTAKGRLLDRLN